MPTCSACASGSSARKVLEVSREHWFGDQTALEALVRFTDEELKHQELFRRLEELTAEGMAPGYRFLPQPNDVASVVLAKSTWAVLALTCHIELFTQAHYRQSVEPDRNLSDLFKDVLLFHWKEESQHAILDEMEWQRENGTLSAAERDRAVNDLIELVAAVDGILQVQSAADVDYFVGICGRSFIPSQVDRLRAGMLKAYRWQYIVSGVPGAAFHRGARRHDHPGAIAAYRDGAGAHRWKCVTRDTCPERGVDTAGTCDTSPGGDGLGWSSGPSLPDPSGSDPRRTSSGVRPQTIFIA
jgi:hypothetical protein